MKSRRLVKLLEERCECCDESQTSDEFVREIQIARLLPLKRNLSGLADGIRRHGRSTTFKHTAELSTTFAGHRTIPWHLACG